MPGIFLWPRLCAVCVTVIFITSDLGFYPKLRESALSSHFIDED